MSYDISDHNPVFVLSPITSLSQNKHHKCDIFKRNFSGFDEEQFLYCLENNLTKINCDQADSNPNTKFSEFVNIFVNCLNDFAPMKRLSRKEAKFYHKPWLTKSIQKSIKEKNKLYQTSCKHLHSGEHFKKYKQYNNILTHVKKQSKQNYYENQLKINKNNIKYTWRTINKIIRKPTNYSEINKIKCPISNQELYSPKEISSCFNNYFSNVASKLASALPKINSTKTTYASSSCSSMFIQPICIDDILIQINSLDINKCDDTYDIPVKIIKLSRFVIAPILCTLINCCIRIGVFPDVLKVAKVLPVHKGGSKECTSNYRPISILPHFSKIFEKILKVDLINFLMKNQIISKCQYGFQQKQMCH